LPGQTDDYFAYKRWFEAGYKAIAIPVGCTAQDPVLTFANLYTWSAQWILLFTDAASHVCVKEHFAKVAGLQSSRRISFAYHYGPTVRKNDDGDPHGEPADPVFIRIDNAGGRPVHLHPEGHPEEHIPQEKIGGLVLDNVDLFDFVKAAIRHHDGGKTITKEFGYKIRTK
jgi:hypothetical protein